MSCMSSGACGKTLYKTVLGGQGICDGGLQNLEQKAHGLVLGERACAVRPQGQRRNLKNICQKPIDAAQVEDELFQRKTQLKRLQGKSDAKKLFQENQQHEILPLVLLLYCSDNNPP